MSQRFPQDPMIGTPQEPLASNGHPPEPVILAIEASQRELSVAVRARDGSIALERGEGDPRDSDQLMPAIDRLMARAGWAPRDLGAVAVSTGPGGFTSLRISIATAKGICEALSIPAIDVPSAMVAAQGCVDSAEHAHVEVALACKGSGFWSTRLAWRGGRWHVEQEGAVESSSWVPAVGLMLADEHLPEEVRARAHFHGTRIALPSLGAEPCLAAAVALWREGRSEDAMALFPRYARIPEAVALWKARHGA
jgi:tRNA threonylcarbamoyl adenosine modification protein YeaZ